MSNSIKYTYDDSADRKIVKEFYRNEFGISLIDTPDTYYVYDRKFVLKQQGKFDVDLIAFNSSHATSKYVEIEKMQLSNYERCKSEGHVNVVESKYYKYFYSNPFGDMVFLIYDNKRFTGKLLLISGSDIKVHCDRNARLTYDSVNNDAGVTYLFPLDWSYVQEHEVIRPALQRSVLADDHIICVSQKILDKWPSCDPRTWKYSIGRKYILDDGPLKFQAYTETTPIKTLDAYYELDRENVKKCLKPSGDSKYDFIFVDDVVNNATYHELTENEESRLDLNDVLTTPSNK